MTAQEILDELLKRQGKSNAFKNHFDTIKQLAENQVRLEDRIAELEQSNG